MSDNTLLVEENPSDGRFDIELELLLRAEVEGEVDGSLRCSPVGGVDKIFLVGGEGVHPSKAVESAHLEGTRFSGISSEPVAQVDSTEQRSIHEAHECASGLTRFVGEVSIAFQSQTENRSEETSNAQSSVGVEVLHPSHTGGFGSHTTIDSDVEVVERLALRNGLSRNGHCHGSGSKQKY